jgi:hypothetical protein
MDAVREMGPIGEEPIQSAAAKRLSPSKVREILAHWEATGN